MVRLIVLRILYAIPTLFAVSILVFLATQALPGDAALAALGRNATPLGLETFRERFNLDAPLYQQYWEWVLNAMRGDFGNSFAAPTSVSALLASRTANTAVLVLVTALLAVPLAILLGIFMAAKRDRAGDHIVSMTMLIINALPEFVLAMMLIVLLATNVFPILPAVSALDPNQPILAQADLLVLPVLTLGLLVLPYVARTVRACLIDELDSDHIRMARLKGISERRIVINHALPNIAGPTLQVVAQSLAWLAGGIIVIETIFQFPGLGLAMSAAVGSRDVPVVQAIAMLLAVLYIAVNILADIGTIALTPTLRRGASR